MGNFLNSKKCKDNDCCGNICKKTGIPYKEIKSLIKPLDMILFRGGEAISSTIRILEKLQTGNGDWSHVGIVVNTTILPNIPNGKSGKLYVWESTLSGDLNDGILNTEGEVKFGVQFRELEKVVKGYNKNQKSLVAWAKLKNNPYRQLPGETIQVYEKRFKELRDNLVKIEEEYGDKMYDANPFALLGSLYPKFRCLRKTVNFGKDWLFCSELVATIYVQLGILDSEEINPADVLPVDFVGFDEDGIVPFHKLPPKILV